MCWRCIPYTEPSSDGCTWLTNLVSNGCMEGHPPSLLHLGTAVGIDVQLMKVIRPAQQTYALLAGILLGCLLECESMSWLAAVSFLDAILWLCHLETAGPAARPDPAVPTQPCSHFDCRTAAGLANPQSVWQSISQSVSQSVSQSTTPCGHDPQRLHGDDLLHSSQSVSQCVSQFVSRSFIQPVSQTRHSYCGPLEAAQR